MYVNSYNVCGRIASEFTRNEYRGSPYTKFVLALNKPGADVQYLDCIAWDYPGRFLFQEAAKGDLVFLSGELEIRTYTNRAGLKQKSVSLRIREVNIVNKKERKEENHPREVILRKPRFPEAIAPKEIPEF